MFDVSHCYYRFPDESSDRLDLVFHHPDMDSIKEFRRSPNTVRFGDLLDVDEDEQPIAHYGVTASGRLEGDIRFVSIQNLSEHGIINGETTYLDTAEDGVGARLRLRKGDILISRSRLVGRAAIATEDWQGATFGSYVILFRLTSAAEYSGDFVVKFINYSSLGQGQVTLLKTGSSGYNINSTQLMDLRLPSIDIDGQRRIVSAVNEIEAQAKHLDELVAQGREMAAETLLSELGIDIAPAPTINYFFKTGAEKCTLWFGIFPDEVSDRMHYLFFHPRYHVLDALRDRYATVCLAAPDVLREPITRGEQPEYDELGEVSVLKTVDLKSDHIDYDSALKVAQELFDAHPTAHVQKDDLLIASTGYVSMGKVDVYDRDEPAMVDGHISILRINEEYDPYFLAYFLRCRLGQVQFEKRFSGSSGQIEVQPADLAQFIVPAATDGGVPLEEQKQIAANITEALHEARQLERQAEGKWQAARETFRQMIHGHLVMD